MFDLGPRETLSKVQRLTLERADRSVISIEALEPLQSDSKNAVQVQVLDDEGRRQPGLIAGGATLEEAVNKILNMVKGRQDVALKSPV